MSGICSGIFAAGMKPVPEDLDQTNTLPFQTVGKVVDLVSGTGATGVRVSERLIVTSASTFLSALQFEDDLNLIWVFDDARYKVAQVSLNTDFWTILAENGIDSIAFKQIDYAILELEETPDNAIWATPQTHRFDEDQFRLAVGFVEGLYSANDPLATRLHATAGGEPVWSEFGQIEKNVYHTGDLKIGAEAAGIPVFQVSEESWTLEGWIVENHYEDGSSSVLGLNRSFVDQLEQILDQEWQSPESQEVNVDYNEQPETASVLPMNHGVMASVSPKADTDFHLIQIEAEGDYLIQSYGETDISGALYNDLLQLIAQDDDSGGSFNFKLELTLEAGTYYLKTIPFSGETVGPYGLSVIRQDDETEYDDDGLDPSVTLDLGINTVSSLNRIQSPGETDTFQVSASQAGLWVVWTESEWDLKTEWVGTTGVESDDARGRNLQPVLSAVVEPGLHQVKVQASTSGEFGPYTIASRLIPINWAHSSFEDSNEFLCQSQFLEQGSEFIATIEGTGDWDYYQFETTNQAVNQTVRIVSDSAPVKVILLDEGFERVGEVMSGNDLELDTASGQSGFYYVIVSSEEPTDYAVGIQ